MIVLKTGPLWLIHICRVQDVLDVHVCSFVKCCVMEEGTTLISISNLFTLIAHTEANVCGQIRDCSRLFKALLNTIIIVLSQIHFGYRTQIFIKAYQLDQSQNSELCDIIQNRSSPGERTWMFCSSTWHFNLNWLYLIRCCGDEGLKRKSIFKTQTISEYTSGS